MVRTLVGMDPVPRPALGKLSQAECACGNAGSGFPGRASRSGVRLAWAGFGTRLVVAARAGA